ncbi:nucleotidyltransferase domain-containing protein [Anabaena azotica]|uniref:nucleotidyltransferase domain-containing protein n=1 Tax=Anabaena azotica TaxID=197653 RepID=UPI0039A4438B
MQELYQNQLEAIILYGSQAREDAKEFSDIDILVVLKSEIMLKIKGHNEITVLMIPLS